MLDVKFGRTYGYEVNSSLFPQGTATNLMQIGGYSSTFDCGFTGGPRSCYVPGVGISGYAGWGETYTATSLSDIYEWKADFTKIHGKHNLSMGAGELLANSRHQPGKLHLSSR